MEKIKVFYCNGKELPISKLKQGDNVVGSTMHYSDKHEHYYIVTKGSVISSDHNSVYDVVIKCDDGVVRGAVNNFMHASVIIEKI
jgi:hypothetical protein